MTRLRQIVHVARKDLRMSRWMLGGYALLVGCATLAALRPGLSAGLLWPLSVALFGTVVTALLVQADSPLRADAFWASQPFDPLAVFGAKVTVVALVLIGVALAAQLVALTAHGVPRGELAGILGSSALVFGLLFGAAAMLGALTPDLRTFMVVSIVLFIAQNVIGLTLMAMRGNVGREVSSEPALLRLLWLLAWPLLLAHIYRTRDRRRGVVLAALLLVVSFVSGMRVASSTVPSADSGAAPAALRAALDIDRFRLNGSYLHVVVRLPVTSPNHAYILTGSTAHIELLDGSRMDVPAHGEREWLNLPAIPLTADIDWVGAVDPIRSGPFAAGIQFELNRTQRSALSSGIARVIVEGRVEVLASRVAWSIPLRAGATAMGEGYRIRIIDLNETADETSVRLGVSQVHYGPSVDEAWPSRDDLSFMPLHVLVDDARGEGIRLYSRGATGSGAGLVILGGPRAWQEQVELATDVASIDDDENPPTHEAWAGRARLLAVDWRPAGGYHVTAASASDHAPVRAR